MSDTGFAIVPDNPKYRNLPAQTLPDIVPDNPIYRAPDIVPDNPIYRAPTIGPDVAGPVATPAPAPVVAAPTPQAPLEPSIDPYGMGLGVDPYAAGGYSSGGTPMAAPAPAPSLAQTVVPMGDRDLEGQRAAAVAEPVSLGDRFALNASDAYYGGTLAGSGQLVELQRAAKMTPQEWAEYNTAVRYAGGALKPLPSPSEAQAEILRIAGARARYEAMPWSGGPLDFGAAVAGQLAGGVVTPESGISRVPGVAQAVGAVSRAAPVIGRTVERAVGETGQAVAGRMLESGLSQGVVNTAVDPLAQVGSIATGMQPGYDPLRTALAFPAGVAIGAGLHGATEAAGAGARALLPAPPVPATSPIDRAVRQELAAAPTVGSEFATERPGVPAPDPSLSTIFTPPEPPRPVVAPEQFPATAAPAPAAGEPYAQSFAPGAVPRIEPAAAPVPGAEPPRPVSSAASTTPAERSIAAAEAAVPAAETSSPPPEPVIGEPVDRPGAPAGRPGEVAPVGAENAAPVEPAGVRAGPGARGDPGERPGDTQAVPTGEQPAERPAVPTEPQARPAEAAPVTTSDPVPPEFRAAARQAPIDRDAQRQLAAEHAARSGVPEEDVLANLQRAGADATLWWFLDGDKPIYAGPTSRVSDVQNAGRTGELSAYGKVDTSGGAVWYKPGQEAAAREAAQLLADERATGADYHRRIGELLGYPKESIDGYLTARGMSAETPRRTALSGLTTEPDHTVPGQHVAKNPGGEVIGKGATPEEATADAQRRGGAPYASEAPVVPGPREEPGTTGPGTEARVLSGSADEQTPAPTLTTLTTRTAAQEQLETPEVPGRPTNPTLERLRITEKKLVEQPTRTPLESLKLQRIRQQISKAERFQEAKDRRAREQEDRLDARRAGRRTAELTGTEPAGPPRNFKPKDFYDYKFNDGNSEYLQAVLQEAGHDPDTVTNLKMERQHEILRQHMVDTFGFRDVTVAKDSTPVDAKTARDAMADMSRAVRDLMASLGYPHEAASFFGTRSLVIDAGSKTRGRFGSYVSSAPGSGEIHVTGGANSFGHEWFHALDHVLAEQLTGNPTLRNELLTKYAREGQLDPTDGVQGAFAQVMNRVFYDRASEALREIDLINRSNRVDGNGDPTKGAIEAARRLTELQQGRLNLRIKASEMRAGAGTLPNARYFTDPVELLARAHEAYSADKMENNGANPRGAVMDNEAYINESIELLKRLYPKDEERLAIFRAFDELHDEIAKAGILSQGGTKPPGAFPNLGVADPVHYGLTLGPRRTNEEAAQARRAINKFANRTRQLETGQILFDRTRPKPPIGQEYVQQLADGAKSVLYANYSIMDLIHDRAPDAAKAPLREIRDRLSTAPGEGRLINETLGEAALRNANQWNRQFGTILENNGIDPRKLERLSPEHDAMIRHHMTTGEKTYPLDPNDPTVTRPIPPELIRVAGGLRHLMDRMYQHGRDVGLDLGYSDQFFPRVYDRYRIFNDEAGFVAQAKKTYQKMFDNDVGAPGSDPAATLEKWTTLSKLERDLATSTGTNTDLAGRMAELNKNLREQREIEAKAQPTPAELTELARLQAEATQLATEAHPLLRDHISEMAANDWFTRLGEPVLHNFDTTGPGGRFLNARVLPPEADVWMRDYMYTSISEAIPHYIEGMARRTADAERFGPQGEDLTRLLKLAQAGGVHPDELQWFVDTIANVRGADKPRGKVMQQVTTTTHALSSIMLMSRAVFSGLGEPMSAAVTTGSARVGMQTFIKQFGGLLRTQSARERTETAELLGVTRAAMMDSVLRSRMGADYSDSPGWNKFMTKFYRTSMLTGVVNSQRAHGAAAMHWAVDRTARDLLAEGDGVLARHAREDAGRMFNENGIPPEHHKDFAQWIVDLDGERPSSALLQKDPMGVAYSLMIRRMVGRANQDPGKVDRAAGASGRGALVFQLQSFAYSFAKNVLYPMMKNIEHSYGRARIEAKEAGSGPVMSRARGLVFSGGTAAHMAAMTGAVLAASIPGAMLKLYLFDRERFDKMMANLDVAELVGQAWSRAGFNGPLDPLIQAFTHSKYDVQVHSLYEGAGPNNILKNAQNVIAPFVLGNKDAPNTNTRMFNAWRGAYNLIGVPLAAGFMTWAGNLGGPLTRFGAGLAMQKITSPGAASDFAAMMTGDKGAKRAGAGGGGGGGLDQRLSQLNTPKLGSAAKGAGPRPAEGAGWGHLSGIVAPAWSKFAPALNYVPFWGKVAGLAIGAGAAGYEAYEAGAPFRGQPKPRPRATRQ